MANDEHLETSSCGVDKWNLWRRDNWVTQADLSGANLHRADLSAADLSGANLRWADLSAANLRSADLSSAGLVGAQLVDTIIEKATLANATVYGASARNLKGTSASQSDLVITRHDEPVITLDDLKVAQFVYLLLTTPSISDVIDTLGPRVP